MPGFRLVLALRLCEARWAAEQRLGKSMQVGHQVTRELFENLSSRNTLALIEGKKSCALTGIKIDKYVHQKVDIRHEQEGLFNS